MSQHYDVNTIHRRDISKVKNNIIKDFNKGLHFIKNSLRYDEVMGVEFKEHEDELVFLTYRTTRLAREKTLFEIHYNSKLDEVTKIYLVH